MRRGEEGTGGRSTDFPPPTPAANAGIPLDNVVLMWGYSSM